MNDPVMVVALGRLNKSKTNTTIFDDPLLCTLVICVCKRKFMSQRFLLATAG
jgi:hypothetical protein